MSILRRDTKYKPRWKDVYDLRPEVPYLCKGFLSMTIPMSLFAENRRRLVEGLKTVSPYGLAIIQAANPTRCWRTGLFVQNRDFFWSFGYEEPRAIGAIDVFFNRTYVFVQRLNEECFIWHGKGLTTRNQLKSHLLVNGIWFLDEIEIFMDFMKTNNYCKEVLILRHQEQELPSCIFRYPTDFCKLSPIIKNLKTHKTEMEVTILRYGCKVLESALIHIMKRLRPGMSDEQVRSWFFFFMTYKSDFEQLSFDMYKASDAMDIRSVQDISTTPREERTFEEGEVCVVDVGAAYFGYYIGLGATLPVSDCFSDIQLTAYNLMLRIRERICLELKAETPLDHIQSTAERCLAEILIEELHLLFGTVDGALDSGVGKLLIPHRLVYSLEYEFEEMDQLELGRIYLIEPGFNFSKKSLEDGFNSYPLKLYLRAGLRQFDDIAIKVSDPVLITVDGFKFLSDMSRQSDVIHELRTTDPFAKCPLALEAEKRNLRISPSLFNLRNE